MPEGGPCTVHEYASASWVRSRARALDSLNVAQAKRAETVAEESASSIHSRYELSRVFF